MTTITLPPVCDRAFAEEFLPEMATMIRSGPLAIDGSQVEQLGQAALQLLLSARHTGDCTIVQPSPALIRTARLTGLGATMFGEMRP